MPTQNQIVGSNIKRYRKLKRLTQTELADLVGVAGNTVSAWERGTIEIPSSRLQEVANVLDVPFIDLMPMSVGVGNKSRLHTIHTLVDEAERELTVKEMKFIEKVIEKTMKLDKEEREKLIDSLKFAVAFFENGSLR